MGLRQGVVSLAKPTASRALWPPGHSTDSFTEAREQDMCFVNHRGSLYPGLRFQAPCGRLDSSSKPSGPGQRRSNSPVSHFLPPVGARALDIHDELPLSETLQSSPLSDPAPGFSFKQILFNFHHPGFLFSPHRFIFYLQDTYFSLPCRRSAFRMDSAQHPFCLASPTPQAFLCAPHSRSSLICYSTPMQSPHSLTPSHVISPQHPKHLPFGPLSTQTFSEHTRLDGTSSFRPGSQHLSQQASELKPDCPKPQSEQEVLHVHHGEHSLPQREQGP